jgi:tellurite resistance protein TehA-like permease
MTTTTSVPLQSHRREPARSGSSAGQPRRPPTGQLVGRLLEWIAPNWFAAVMGTGILATSAAGLPIGTGPAARVQPFAVAAWLLAAGLLAGICALTAGQWLRHPGLARGHHHHPVLAHFYGAPPMALLTVGTGALLLGQNLLGLDLAVRIDWALWSAGTLLGLLTSFAVPYLLFTRQLGEQATRPEAAFGGWLMSVVPPMVSASTGALLLPHTPPGQARLTLLLGCYAMFGISLIASLIIIPLVWARLARFGLPEPRMIPTLWIVLGPLGQSVTAAVLLGERASLAIGDPFAGGLRALGLIYGVPVFGFAMLWALLAATITIRTVRSRAGLPFAPTWWSFTFPVGTCVTGASGLARLSGADVFSVFALTLFAGLLLAWLVVSVRALGSARIAPQVWSYSI